MKKKKIKKNQRPNPIAIADKILRKHVAIVQLRETEIRKTIEYLLIVTLYLVIAIKKQSKLFLDR